MGIKRVVDTAFWTDGKVDEFTPEDKYFMLYLLTNPFTTQLGIYEISIKQVAFQLGYSMEAVKALIERFEKKYGIVIYSPKTHEIAIKNFLRHSIVKGGAPVRDCLIKEIKRVKNKDLVAKVFAHIKQCENLNETVKNIISDYEEKNGVLHYTNEKDNKNDIDNDNGNENENEVSYPDSYNDSFHDSFTPTPPTLPDVIDYVKNNNLAVNPNRFFSYYNDKGWKTAGGKDIDWKAKIHEWDYEDKQKAGSNTKPGFQSSTNPFLALAKDENLI